MKDTAEKISWYLFLISVFLIMAYFGSGFWHEYSSETAKGLKEMAIWAFSFAVGGKGVNLIGEGIKTNGFRVVGDNVESEESEGTTEVSICPPKNNSSFGG